MRELCACISNDNKNVTAYQTIDAIVEAGFKWAFIQWYDKDWEITQQQQLDYAREKGLKINFAHLGYQHVLDLWKDNEIGQAEVSRYIQDLKDCKANGIDLVIMHLHGKHDELDYSEIGYRRLQTILDEAEKIGVKVAFENTRSRLAMDKTFENVHSSAAGFCFDGGHSHAYFNDSCDFEAYQPVLAVHIHDNHSQRMDEHLLPFDGTIDYEKQIKELVEAGYRQQISLEICYQKDYLNQYSLEQFYKEGYERGLKLAEIFGKYDQQMAK